MANRLVEIIVQVKDEASAAFERLKGAIGSVGGAVFSLKGLLVGLVGGAVVKGIEGLVDAFSEQEKVTTRLNSALRVTGRFTQEASDAIQKMADDMRTLTTHTDEEALAVSAQFASLARELTTTQLAEAQKVAIGFADATGRSVEGAAQLIIRSITGQGNALKRYGVDLDTSGSQQEKFNEVVRKLGPLFNISVESAKTLSGQIAQAKNEFNELKETLGGVVVEVLGLHEKSRSLRDLFIDWRKAVAEHSGEIVAWGRAFVEILGAAWSAAKILWEGFRNGVVVVANVGVALFNFGRLIVDVFRFGFLAMNDFFDRMLDKAIDTVNDLITAFNKVSPIDMPLVKHGPRVFAESMDEARAAVTADSNAIAGAVDTMVISSGESLDRMKKDWSEAAGHVKAAAGQIAGAAGTKPIAGTNTAGAGANLGAASGPDPSAQLRGALELQKQLKAQYDAGAITLEVYNRRLEGVSFTLERLGNLKGVRELKERQEALDAAVKAGEITRERYAHDTADLDRRLQALIKSTNLTAGETTQLYEALAKLKDVKIDRLLQEQEALALRFQRGQIGAKEYDDALRALTRRMEELLRAAGLTEEQIKKIMKAMVDAGKSTVGLGDQLKRAFGLEEGGGLAAVKAANEEVAKMTYGLGTAFADAVGQALTAGGNFGKTIAKAVGQAAAANAKFAIGRSIMELAEGVAASFVNPPAAAGHFAAAKTFAVAAAFMGGIAGATGGFSGGAGGNGAGAGAAVRGAAEQKAAGTIIIQGGLLDMSNPDQAEAFSKAVSDLTGRDVIVARGY